MSDFLELVMARQSDRAYEPGRKIERETLERIIEAARMAHAGMSVRQIVEIIEKLKPRVRASFVVDTLTFLHRGGRCSGAAALVGSTLKLHPRIAVENGKMGQE